jgi:hypothetical protein
MTSKTTRLPATQRGRDTSSAKKRLEEMQRTIAPYVGPKLETPRTQGQWTQIPSGVPVPRSPKVHL